MEAVDYIFAEEHLDDLSDEMLTRFKAGESLGVVISEIGARHGFFRGYTKPPAARVIIEHWPASHLEQIRWTVIAGLTMRKQGVPIRFHWKGDDEHPETITSILFKENDIHIEFAHPPNPPKPTAAHTEPIGGAVLATR
jgi:hypothetical protein